MAQPQQKKVDRAATNGWGSTPAERHYITHTQALQVINAGIERSIATG